MKRAIQIACVAIVVSFGSIASAKVNIETVSVGNAGNAGEQSRLGKGDTTYYGGVAYEYNIGKYEVTAGQYTEFLNNVAGVDSYGLYDTFMWLSPSYGYPCKVERYTGSGTAGDPYQYRVDANWANRPVNYVSWGSAARFVNWLHNGQPAGTLTGDPVQDAGLTEDGAYHLNGATTDAALHAVSRESDWRWAIPSEGEWYKAAYYDPSLNSGAGGYYDYPTSSDSAPGYIKNSGNFSRSGDGSFSEGGTDPGNYATYNGDSFEPGIGSPYYRTIVGEWENSDSPYGTFDQGGNIWEFTELIHGGGRGLRGGSFTWDTDDHNLRVESRNWGAPEAGVSPQSGFRVVEVPEPATMALLALGALAVGRKRRR
jgi:formylglycine-generating enzyme